MDKKNLLGPYLARIMIGVKEEIQNLTILHPLAPSEVKLDGSPVTALDLALSELLEKTTNQFFPETTVYSEENYSEIKFPLMAIDPLDGTREYIKQRPEWAVSLGHFSDKNFAGEGWVYNPKTDELFDENQKIFSFEAKSLYKGEVSHSEWERGFFKHFKSQKFSLKPMGSIAYKLGRLSTGEIDFVVSLAPKSIWDIAGGSLLCQRSGIKFYSEGQEVTEVKHLYYPPLIWCSSDLYSELSSLFPPKDKHL